MKVLLIGKYYYPHPGGIERHTYNLVNSLSSKKDIEVLDCLASSDTKRTETRKLPKGRLYKAGTRFTLFSTPISPYFFSYLRKHQYDIIHIHLPNPLATIAFLVARPKSQLIVHIHAIQSRYKILDTVFNFLFMRPICERSQAIIFSSRKIIKGRELYNKYREKISIAPLGIDCEYWNGGPRSESQMRLIKQKYRKRKVLFVGRFTHYKGVEYFIDCAQYVDADFLLIGDGDSLREQKEMARRRKNIFFLGRVSDALLRCYYYASDIVVLPSTSPSETFGIVQLEAMACGKPVIVTRINKGSAVDEPIKKGAYGLIVEPKSTKSLAQGISKLLDESSLKNNKEGARNNINIVQSFYSIDKTVDITMNIYRKAYHGKPIS